MAEKKLKISADFDDTAFKNGVKKAMEELNKISRDPRRMEMQAQLDQRLKSLGYGGLPGSPDYEKTVQARKKNEQEQKRYVQDLLKEQQRLHDLEEKVSKRKISSKEQEKKLEQDIKKIKDAQIENEGKLSAATEKKVRTLKELFQNIEKEFKAGGISGLREAWAGMSRPEKIGFGATAIGGVLGALGAGAEYMSKRNIDMLSMQGSAIAQTTGRQFAQARSGEYVFESMYGGDRQKAKEEAASARKWGTAADILALVGGVAAVAAAIPTGGASLGIGGALMGGAGLLAAGSTIGKGILDPEKYRAYRSEQEAQDFNRALEALHEKDPVRKDAIERLRNTSVRDLNMQRMLSLKDKDYYGPQGFLLQQMGGQFTDEMVTQASKNILSAGGSTAMAKESAFALRAERGLDLTNAPQLLGMLSGTQGIPETSKKTLIDIFARGFDSSKYAEENRKYMEAVTEEIYKGGTKDQAAASAIAELMRSTVKGEAPTMREIQAGKGAFQAFQAAGTAQKGFLGAMNIASAMGDPLLSQITDPVELTGLLNMKYSEISEEDEAIKDTAERYNMSPKALAERLRRRQPEFLKTAITNPSVSTAGQRAMTQNLLGATDQKTQQAILNMLKEPPSSQRDEKIQKAIEEAQDKIEGRVATGRAGDDMVKAAALNAENSLKSLSESIDEFAKNALKSAESLSKREYPAQQEISRRQTELDTLRADIERKGGYTELTKGEQDRYYAAIEALNKAKEAADKVSDQPQAR